MASTEIIYSNEKSNKLLQSSFKDIDNQSSESMLKIPRFYPLESVEHYERQSKSI